jgi:hypothetical protein
VLRWFFQEAPHDQYDATGQAVLLDAKADGRTVPAVLECGKAGWCFVIDRADGKLLFRTEEVAPHQNTYAQASTARGGITVAPRNPRRRQRLAGFLRPGFRRRLRGEQACPIDPDAREGPERAGRSRAVQDRQQAGAREYRSTQAPVDDLQKRLDRLQAHRVTAAQWGELGAAHRALRIDRRPGRLIVYIGVTLQP